MSGEKTNDFNGVHIAGAAPPGPLYPPALGGCWCGASAVGTISWMGVEYCAECAPGACIDAMAAEVSTRAPQVRAVKAPVQADAARELVPALTKAVNRLCAILEAVATHGGKLTIEPSAPATRPAAGAPAGSRVKLGGRRGVVRSSGIAGMAIQWDDGAYDVLTSSMTRGIVLE